MTELLGKSPKGEHRITLLQHTRAVVEAAHALFGTAMVETRLGRCWRRFFRVEDSARLSFHKNLIAACVLHDWGKANDGMQKALTGTGVQAIRHEHFSVLLTCTAPVYDWLTSLPGLDVPLIVSAVLTHHLKAGFDPTKRYGFAGAENGAMGFRSLHRTPAFAEVLDYSAQQIGGPPPDLSHVRDSWTFSSPASFRGDRDYIRDEILEPLKKSLRVNEPRRRMLLAVRSGLIVADAAGSGLVREGYTVSNWIHETVEILDPWNGEDIREKIIGERIAQLTRAGKWKDQGDGKEGWSDFQLACDSLPERALLLAPCGSGKTLAAWRWIAAQLDRRPARHALFLYPTRATAREGFKDYVSWAPAPEAALMHGTSRFDLTDMFANDPADDARKHRDYEAERRLFALGFWGRRAFSATIDQFLAFMQYGYGPMCMLPVLADSVVVIDEVHSFDRNMLSALKEFLTTFDVPVLCMTATLPEDRKTALVNCGLSPYAERPGELDTIAKAPRYRLRELSCRSEAVDQVRCALAKGRRVLWVVNTVRRAHEIVREFADPISATLARLQTQGVPLFCFHSRLRLSDLVQRHGEVVDGLKANQPAALGVTTQVCEMSLDIDVDLLVTERCPVTALVQRMGRCNRERAPRSLGVSGDILVYKPGFDLPYSPEDLVGLTEFLDLTNGRELSQDDLEKAMARVPCPPWGGDTLCSFTASGPYAVAGEEEFRDGEEFNLPCILDVDVTAFLHAVDAERRGSKTVLKDGFVLPAPRKLGKLRIPGNPEHDRLPRYLGVAPSANYHPLFGLCDEPLASKGLV
jgi:CRISPR-associated endonuclease/helicase Cas3